MRYSLTCILSKLFQARYINDIGRQAGVWLSEADARRARPPSSMTPRCQTPLDVGAHLAAVRPPVAKVVLPLPHGNHGLRLTHGSGRRSWRRRSISGTVYTSAGARNNRHVQQAKAKANNSSLRLARSNDWNCDWAEETVCWASWARYTGPF